MDEVVELVLDAQGAQDDLVGQSGVAGGEGSGGFAEEVGGVSSGGDLFEDDEGGLAGGG
jgi:hypothetical protein